MTNDRCLPIVAGLLAMLLACSAMGQEDEPFIVLRVEGSVSRADDVEIAPFDSLAADTEIVLRRKGQLSLVVGDRQVDLRGPAMGLVGDMVATSVDLAGPEDPAETLLARATQALASWLTEAEQGGLAGVRSPEAVGDWNLDPPSTAIAPVLLGDDIAVRVGERIRSDRDLVLQTPTGERPVDIEGGDEVVVLRTDLAAGTVSLVAVAPDAPPRILASWPPLSAEAESTLATSLRRLDPLCEGVDPSSCTMLRAAIYSEMGCHAQAWAEVEGLGDESAGTGGLTDRTLSRWRPITLATTVAFRPPGDETYLALPANLTIPTGSVIRVELHTQGAAALNVRGRNRSGDWIPIPGLDTSEVLARSPMAFELPLEGAGACESLCVEAYSDVNAIPSADGAGPCGLGDREAPMAEAEFAAGASWGYFATAVRIHVCHEAAGGGTPQDEGGSR